MIDTTKSKLKSEWVKGFNYGVSETLDTISCMVHRKAYPFKYAGQSPFPITPKVERVVETSVYAEIFNRIKELREAFINE